MNEKNAHLARRKMSHIIDELYTALFRAGGDEVNVKLRREENGLRLFVEGDFDEEHRESLQHMMALLTPQVRNPALVQAYWELAGGDQYTSDSEMSLVGQMLDDAVVEFFESGVRIELYLAF